MDAYVISLPGHETRRDRVAARLQAFGLDVHLAHGVKVRSAPGQCTHPGEYGCTLAHYQILKAITKPVVITEDDVEFHKGLEALPDPGHEMALYGSAQYHWQGITITDGMYWANHKSNGTFAYYITPGIAHTVATLIDQGHIDAMDRLYKRFIYPEHRVPVYYPNLVIANVATSDIRNPRNRETHARKTRWNLADYEP